MSAAVVVFAVGNPSRGDDAIGPLLCGRLAKWLENEGLADGFELIEDFQLQIEHALDLQGRELALFIDAGTGTPAPCTFQRIPRPPASRTARTRCRRKRCCMSSGRPKAANRRRPSCCACAARNSGSASR